jgi:flagellar biosynthesis/type III secretory pathway protein FliH
MTEEYDKGFKDGFEEGFYANDILEKNEYDIGFEAGFKAGLEAAKQSIIEVIEKENSVK